MGGLKQKNRGNRRNVKNIQMRNVRSNDCGKGQLKDCGKLVDVSVFVIYNQICVAKSGK